MINKLKRLHIGRGLISQYLLVFFAFLLMVMIGDYYAGNLVNKYLATYGDDVVIISADTLESYLEGYQYTFEDMVYFIQDMYGANPNAENINDELVKWNARLYATDKRYQDYLFIYGLIGDEFMYGLDWDIPLDYDPKSRPWYIGAYENYGELFYCDPYVDMRTGEWVISISKVLIDANDNPFGVLAFDFYLTSIGNYVVNLKLLDNGYGVLLDSNMNFIIHPEPSVFGMKLDDIQPEKAVLMRSNDSISAYRYNSVTGVDSVMFGRKLFNGWYLYVASPYDDFYRDINTMFIVLSFTAFMFTLMLCGILTFMHHAKHHSDEEKKRAKSLLDAAPLGAMIWDRNLKLFDCNQETVKLFGLKDELDFINRIAELSPLYQSDGVLSSEKSVAYLLKALDEGKHVFEWTHQCPDGTPIPAEITLVRVNYSNDIAIAAYVRDLRLHKQMMTEIENQNNIISAEKHRIEELAHFYESILDAIPSLITVTDADKNRIFVNKAIEDILDTRMKDLIGKQCSTFNADICGSEDCGIERAKRGKKKTYFKHNERTYQAITEILKDMDGITTGYIEFAQDITSLQDTAWRLEEALTEAQKANQGKSDFLSSMSHEIRTPMNIILGMTELMLLEPLNDKQLDYINDIKMSAKSLLAIINDILDMSKIEAGKSKLLPVNYHFHALLKHIKAIFSYAAKNKNIDFYVESEPHLPKILFGDDIRLLQVLTNIINNAIKFTHKGYVKLRVTTEESQLLFEVIDTGIGIREEDIANLFNAFMQVDIHKNRGVVGTGLGLTISKSFVEMMGGSISIESEYGRGTVFRILIPMVKGTEE
ncbi:MAG: ATP-binding protein, partial [Lachnospiraceae bacterium]|nr:ATP-binding protein [Lachnospiraceae bacterium]